MPKTIYDTDKIKQTFHAKVNKQSGVRPNGLPTDCWEWTGANVGVGYGWFRDGYAHRRSYELFIGEIPDGRLIRHKCDNRLCANPDHLELGTKAENNKDCQERNPKASGKKLADEELPKIAERMKQGELLKDIAKDYGMNWKAISRRLKSANLRPEYCYGAKVTEETIARMRTLQTAGASYEEIARDVGLSTSCVWNYLN
jgi:hypothetical protein